MNVSSHIILSFLMILSCQKDLSEYQPEFQPYAKELQKRVRSIRTSVLKDVDVLITEHWQKIAFLSCNFCRLEDKYFAPLRDYLIQHPETINRVLERGIGTNLDNAADLLVFKYFIIHHLPDIHERIMEYFDVDLASVPEYGKYYGNMDIWIEFYLNGT